MDTATILTQLAALPPALPKFHALVDYGHGLYQGFDIHTQALADAVSRTQQAILLLADGYRYEVRNGQTTSPQPYAARSDLRFVWTPIPHG